MNDITHKISSLRSAVAIGAVFCTEEIIERIKKGDLPKGEPFQVCASAAMLAAKQTASLIPHCHPVPIDGLEVKHFFYDEPALECFEEERKVGVYFVVEAKSIGRTGIEMEALTAVSLACLTLYDLLKYLGKEGLSIGEVKLLDKKGGKSDKPNYPERLRRAVLISNLGFEMEKSKVNRLFDSVSSVLEKSRISTIDRILDVSEDQWDEVVSEKVKQEMPLILILGKTSTRTDWIKNLEVKMDKKLDGFVHGMYAYGLNRNPLATNSNLTAGIIGKSLIVSLPGSRGGAVEALSAILPRIFHPLLALSK